MNISVYAIPGIARYRRPRNVIIEDICKYFNVTLKDVKSKYRGGNVKLARQFIHYYLRELNKTLSLSRIGRETVNDHTTVLHSIKRLRDLFDVDSEYKEYKKDLDNRLLL